MYQTILVATDGSDAADEAVAQAIELAARFDADLRAVAVLESRTEYDNAIVDPEEVERRRRTAAEETLAAVERDAREASVGIETELRTGPAHEEILAAADACDADAIVVGDRGRSTFRRAVLGSTAERVVRLASRSVLVVGTEG